MPIIDLKKTNYIEGRYPKELMKFYNGITDEYKQIKIGDLGGLTQYGVNKAVQPPNAATAMRHRHENEDEFIIILSGKALLLDNEGEHEITTGDIVTFKAGDDNGHAIINKSDKPVELLEVGARSTKETVHYSDKNLIAEIDRSQKNEIVTFKDKSGNIITRK